MDKIFVIEKSYAMMSMRIVCTIVLALGFYQPALVGESASRNPKSGERSSSIRQALESGNTALKKLQFIDEDGDGINDFVMERVGFSNSNIIEMSPYGDQSGYTMFSDGVVGNGVGRGSRVPRSGSLR